MSLAPDGDAPDSAPTRRPLVLYEAGQGGLRVAAANGPARAAGIQPGLTLSDACARMPGLTSEEIDRAADRAALKALAAWAIRYTPLSAVDGSDGLMLETTGCDHLFGGEQALLADLDARLAAAGLSARLGLAGTPAGAAALARGAPECPARLPPGGEHEGLADLPVAALRLSLDTLTTLRRFGLTRIGQLYGIDRAALARRFVSRTAADAVVTRLDEALGLRHAPLAPLRPPPDYAARQPCPEPLLHADGIRAGLDRLLETVCAQLADHGRGARSFTLTAFRADGGSDRLDVAAARPVRDPAHVRRLFDDRLGALDPGFGIDLLLLEARRVGAMASDVRPLSRDLAGQAVDLTALSALADRLSARLGPGTAQVAHPEASHLPERAARWRAFEGTLPTWPAGGERPDRPRPVSLLERPEPVEVLAEVPDGPPLRFIWRRVARRVLRADGPERIAPEWWHHWPAPPRAPTADAAGTDTAPASRPALPRTRDYYRIEDETGRRYWVFRDGLYGDGRGGAPGWYVHGLFP